MTRESLTVAPTPCPMEWETALLGRSIARVSDLEAIVDVAAGIEALRDVDRQASARFELLVARVPTEHFPSIWALEASGYVAVDVGVTFQYDLASTLPPIQVSPTIQVREARPSDLPALEVMVAAGMFRHSYYYVSPFFSRAEADTVHRTWISNCIHGKRQERVLVAVAPGGVLGFVACRALSESVGVIDLIGVAEAHTARGIGKALVRSALESFRRLHHTTVRVRTQVTNIAAVNLYASTGFRLLTVDTTLMKSLANGTRI